MKHHKMMTCIFGVFVLLSFLFVEGWVKNILHNFSVKRSCILGGERVEGRSCGIDLGTTYSLVSIIEDGKPKLLSIDESYLLPSVVSYIDDKSVFVGQDAVRARESNPENTFSSVKRIMGRTYDAARRSGDSFLFGKRLKAIISDNETIDQNEYCGLYVKSLEQIKKPEEISSEILRRLIQRAESYYGGEKITRAVITVPAYFNPIERAATEKAGLQAGLSKVKLLKEPEAAAIAYGLMKSKPQLILVFDLGGGTFDVSVLEVGGGLVEVIATNGDSHLGGDDFDKAIVDWILTGSKCISVQEEQVIRSNIHLFNKVKAAAARAKLELTKFYNTTISLPVLDSGEVVKVVLSRKKFESLVNPLLQRILKPVRDVALLAGINLPGESGIANIAAEDNNDEEVEEEISDDVLSEISLLEKKEKEGRRRAKARQKAEGNIRRELARIRKIGGSSVKLFPGGQPLDDVLLVGGATRMPCIINLVRALTGVDPKRYLNPDEAICLGAGVLAGTLDGTIDGFEIVSQFRSAVLRTFYEDSQRAKKSTREEKTNISSNEIKKKKCSRISIFKNIKKAAN